MKAVLEKQSSRPLHRFQIEADFAGIMSPGLPECAAEICDRVGHLISYGDGWYGGVYVATMYSLAYVESDVETVVKEALRAFRKKANSISVCPM